MNRAVWFGVVVGLVIVVGAFAFLRYYNRGFSEDLQTLTAPPPAPPSATEAGDEVAAAEPSTRIENPVPEPVEGRPPLPELDDSDGEVLTSLRELFGAQTLDAYLVPREPIRRFVLYVDSLDREPLPLWLRPVRRIPGVFAVDAGEQASIAASNAQRYDAAVAVLARTDMARVAQVYRRYYPLFQDAYDRLGNPRTRYFNDRLIRILDHLDQTPDVAEPILVVRPKVLYLYADPELEELSSGQKVLLRMGSANRAAVKAKLRELRAAIATAPAQ
jgi:hypothetical protein